MSGLRSSFSSLSSSLVGWAVLLPGLAGVWTVVAVAVVGDPPASSTSYDAWPRLLAVASAFVAAVVTWLLLALATRRFANVDGANIAMYEELVIRHSDAETVRANVCGVSSTDPVSQVACAEAQANLTSLGLSLDRTGSFARSPDWVLGSGYIAAWQQLHRAEQALLEVEPDATVAAKGLYDLQRLDGSAIANRASLSVLQRAAIHAFIPGLSLAAIGAAPGTGEPAMTPAMARASLRETRRIINEYRDDAAAGLVRLRRRLTQGVLFTGVVAYLVLGLAVLAAVPLRAIMSASVLYLVGTLIGLFQRLHAESKLQAVEDVDDYGLGTARMIHLSLLSGMAAIAGVALFGLLAGAPLTEALTASAQRSDLAGVFDVINYPIILVIAAVFGLAPGLLLTRLGSLGDSLKVALSSSEPDGTTQQT